MRVANWNPNRYDVEIGVAAMDRLRKSATVVRDAARAKMAGFKHTWREHGPYNSGKDAGKIWTARDYDALKQTIRTVEKYDQFAFGMKIENRNIWVMAGNYKTWYAKQVEYGKGGWKGGPHPFLRKALNESKAQIKTILENG